MSKTTKTSTTLPRMVRMKVADLRAHPDPVRRADPVDLFRLRKSVERFGFLRPGFVLNMKTGMLLDGERLLEMVKERGDKEVDVWQVEVELADEDAAHLTLQNHVGEWDWKAVSLLLKEIQARGGDLGLTGFHDSDTGPLTAADWSATPTPDPEQIGLL